MMRATLLAVGALSLSSCGLLQGNVKGNFVCDAPAGMCAPTSKIDDQALAVIAAGEVPKKGTRAEHQSAHSLKIVFPPRRDRFGRWRDASVVYAEQLGGEPDDRPVVGAASAEGADNALAAVAARAPSVDLMAGGAVGAGPTPREIIEAEVRAQLGPRHNEKKEQGAPGNSAMSAPAFPAAEAGSPR